MILRALYELAQEEGLDTVYEPLRVGYLIHLGTDGRYLGITATPADPSWERNRGSSRPVQRLVPRQSGRTSAARAEFLVDKAEYVFGVDPTNQRTPKGLVDRKRLFQEGVTSALADRRLARNAGLRAVERFLSQPIPNEIEVLLNPSDSRERKAMGAAWFAFVYEPDGGAACVHEHADVRAYFAKQLASTNIAGRGQCLVTGERDVPLAKLHASPKGVPGGSPGTPLTSVNQPAFQSYGLDDIGCAPISATATLAIDAALSRLLVEGYLGSDGRPLPTRRILLDRRTVFVYWSRGGAVIDYLTGLDSDDPEKVAELLRSPHAGRPAALADPSAFYAMVLSGSKGRAVVRTLLESTVSEVAQNIARHFEASRILRPFGRGEGAYPLRELRRAIAVLGDSDRLPPSLATDLYTAVLEARPYPRILFESAVRRMRVDPTGKRAAGRAAADHIAARCSLMKACFVRNYGKEVSVSLNTERRDPAYRLGRLLATLDKIQQDALGDVNATMVDRYYGSASSTPATVFPTLVRRSQHHLSKLRKEKPGLAVVREKLLQEIVSGLDSFARTMPLEDQGLFSLGFYHQRQDFFTKKEA